MLRTTRGQHRRGIVLVAVAVCLLLMTAGLGMGIDLNRLLIHQRALRSAAEASALAAAIEFNGTAESEQRARARALALWREQAERLGNPPMKLTFSADGAAHVSASTMSELTLLRSVVAQRAVPIHTAVGAHVVERDGRRMAEVLP